MATIEQISKYNWWGNPDIPLGHERTSYLDDLYRYAGTNLIKVLVGQRRAGKSYLLRQVAHKLISSGIVDARNTLSVNMEYMEYANIRTAEDLEQLYQDFKKIIAGDGRIFLFIDEIQNIEGWERFVNSHSQDFAEPCEIYITGSNSSLLSGELATLLSGRYVQCEVLPYSYSEYCKASKLQTGLESYRGYLHDSAMPEVLNLVDDDMRRSYLQSIVDTVMLRDIVTRYKIKDAQLLTDIFVYLVNNASSLVSITNIVNYFKSRKRKTNYETVSAYIDYLQRAFLVHKAERYDIKGKETVGGTAKYYLNDLGFHNYLYRGFGYGEGYLLENAVYLQLRRKGYHVYVGSTVGREIDFVAIKGDERIYVQVTLQLDSEATLEREYAPFVSVHDNYPKYVVSLDAHLQPSNNGVQNIWPWMM